MWKLFHKAIPPMIAAPFWFPNILIRNPDVVLNCYHIKFHSAIGSQDAGIIQTSDKIVAIFDMTNKTKYQV
jgi:hypothetical protein